MQATIHFVLKISDTPVTWYEFINKLLGIYVEYPRTWFCDTTVVIGRCWETKTNSLFVLQFYATVSPLLSAKLVTHKTVYNVTPLHGQIHTQVSLSGPQGQTTKSFVLCVECTVTRLLCETFLNLCFWWFSLQCAELNLLHTRSMGAATWPTPPQCPLLPLVWLMLIFI